MIPDPLHPAVVHFPIVLLLLGAPLAVVAVFVRRWNLPVLAAVVVALGAAGAVVATWTGGEAAELAGELSSTYLSTARPSWPTYYCEKRGGVER